jgi:hypothetical protein
MKNYRDEATLNTWYKNYYRGTIFNAFDTLIKKFSSLSSLRTAGNQFNPMVNVSTKVDGMEIAMDNHITKPFSYNSLMWDYRLAQINYSSLFTKFHDLEFLSNTTLDLANQSVNNSTLDPLTGTRRNGPPINVNTPPPPPPQPANGSRLTLQFKNYDLAVQQFDQLSKLGQFVFSTCSLQRRPNNVYQYYINTTFPPTLVATLNLKEFNLLTKVRNPAVFVLHGATDLETFNVDFHISNNSTVRNSATFSNSEIFGLRPAMIIIYTTN